MDPEGIMNLLIVNESLSNSVAALEFLPSDSMYEKIHSVSHEINGLDPYSQGCASFNRGCLAPKCLM